ncbi:MAG: DUF4175 family protein, partial [Alphaproteobacteria bacterium]
RHDLGDVMLGLGEQLGEIPSQLGRAEFAMREATRALEGNNPGDAALAQQRALDELQRGMQSASEALGKQMRSTAREGRTPGGTRQDPLGRPLQGEGGVETGSVRIPEKMEMQRARDILDELRRRWSDPARPAPEREYIDRLLPRF